MPNPRQYQRSHKQKYKGDNCTEASHKISAKELDTHNLKDAPSNYRNNSFNKNRSVDTYIDRQVIQGKFKPGNTKSGTYVSNQNAVDRIQQKINVLKESGQKDSSAHYNGKLMAAAKDAGADLRMFNGVKKDGRRK